MLKLFLAFEVETHCPFNNLSMGHSRLRNHYKKDFSKCIKLVAPNIHEVPRFCFKLEEELYSLWPLVDMRNCMEKVNYGHWGQTPAVSPILLV